MKSIFPDRHPKISKTQCLQLNWTQIRTQNCQKFHFTPSSGQKLFMKILIFSTSFHFLAPEWFQMVVNDDK